MALRPVSSSLPYTNSTDGPCVTRQCYTHSNNSIIPRDPAQVAKVIEARGKDGRSLLTAAAEGGNDAVFSEVLDLMRGKVNRRGFMTAIGPDPRRTGVHGLYR